MNCSRKIYVSKKWAPYMISKLIILNDAPIMLCTLRVKKKQKKNLKRFSKATFFEFNSCISWDLGKCMINYSVLGPFTLHSKVGTARIKILPVPLFWCRSQFKRAEPKIFRTKISSCKRNRRTRKHGSTCQNLSVPYPKWLSCKRGFGQFLSLELPNEKFESWTSRCVGSR
jgi:hypothetical protein